MKILFVAGTNFELYYLSSVVYLLRSYDKSLEFKLFLRRNFANNITPEVRSLYSEIELFQIPALTPPLTWNPAKMLYNIFENFYDYLVYRNQMKENLSKVEIACICGIKEFFANVLAKHAPKNLRIVALRLANQRLEETKEFRKRPFLSFLLNIKNRIFGYSPVEYKWSFKGGLDPLTKNFVSYPYHRTISITDHNIGREDSFFRLPPPFVALKKLYKGGSRSSAGLRPTDSHSANAELSLPPKLQDQTPAILLAGDKTPFYEGWAEKDEKTYESVLDFLRENFPKHKLYFKPKIGRTDPSKYNLAGFELLSPDISLEEICLRYNIQKVISIRSTSSKVGSYFGIPSYMLYPLFPIPERFKEGIENEHYDMRSVVRVSKLEDILFKSDTFIQQYNLEKLAELYWQAIVE
ncbi:MAG: hypothetical protein G01um101430_312 [Parcubacteria group bacterium Gr01-1014_30]|nr:MAG: hypothetical protein G01um101430_312 [Parcubacteria group bacterium Gr01-1014_30]